MPLSPTTRSSLKNFYRSIEDRVLTPSDPVYVEGLNAADTAHGGDPIAAIATEIDWQEGGGVCLFTGQRGTGKSTELKRLQATLKDAGAIALYADMSEYILLSKEIEISDFLVSLCGALDEKLHELYQDSPGRVSYWERFSHFLQTTKIGVSEVGASLSGVGIKASLRTDPLFKQRVQEGMRGHIAQLIADAHAFVRDSVAWMRAQENNGDKKLVLIVDSIERIRGVGADAMKVYESVRNLFFNHSESLRIPKLHVVYTVPPYLSILAAGAGTLMGGAATRRLVSTHIFKDRCRDKDDDGLEIMRKIIGVRYPQWALIFRSEALDRLALSSGGDLREFFRLLRLCLPIVQDDAQLPLKPEDVVFAENAARNEMLPIPADHLGWLKRITQTHDTCLASDKDLPTLAHFLDNRLVLNYRNSSDWYDIHPLLRQAVDAHASAAA